MSILLDALKKSEERRQSVGAPDMQSTGGPTAVRRATGRKRMLFALLAVVVVALTWYGWRHYRQPGAAPEPGPAAAPELTAAPGADTPPAQVAVGQEPPAPDAGQRTPVETFAADSTAGPEDGTGPRSEAAATAPKKDQVIQSFTDFEAPAEPAAAAQKAPPKAASTGAAKTAAPQAAAEPSRAARPPATATEPISFWELPQGVRDSLPDLRITVLVFAERPEDRFVLIGGQRRVEGDRFPDGLVLEEIRRGGAVFTYRNYRFLLKG
jgi:general secretion pathway protein B